MAYTTGTFGGYQYKAPIGTLYCFSPYYIEIAGTSANQKVTLTVNSIPVVRYTNSNYKCKFHISTLLRSFYYGVDFSDIAPSETGVYNNLASKLHNEAQITVVVGTDVANPLILVRSIILGALQQGDVLPTIINVFCWRDGFNCLPLTITPNDGSTLIPAGTDFWLSEYITDDEQVRDIELSDGISIIKTYKVTDMPYCDGGHYLRWIDPTGEYKYFYFTQGSIIDELKDGATIQQNVWGLDDYKSDIILKDKSGNQTYECGVLTASYAQQLHLIGLQRSIKQWIWENDVWIECRVEMPPIVINRFRSPIEVNIKIIKPSLYLPSL